MKKLFAPFACILLLALITTGAYAGPIEYDEFELTAAALIGTISDGTPAAHQVTYANQLIYFYNTKGAESGESTFDHLPPIGKQHYVVFGYDLPTELEDVNPDGSVYIDSPAFPLSINDPYLYLYVKFGAGSALFYLDHKVGDLTSIYFPGLDAFPGGDGQGEGVSHIVLFNPWTTKVPEPGTLLLLGSGLLAMGFTGRRWFRK